MSNEYEQGATYHMRKRGEHHGLEHARWRDVSAIAKAGGRRSFALVRNPWARVSSRFQFGLQVIRDGKANETYKFTTFDEFLAERHVWGSEPYYWHRAVRGWYPAVDYVTDEDGRLQCDILRTEMLDEDVKAYLGQAPPRRVNVTRDARDYRELYDARTIQIVADWYAADIEAFGFDFDTAATRNVWEGLAS